MREWVTRIVGVAALLLGSLTAPMHARLTAQDLTAAVVAEELVAGGAEWRFWRGKTEPSRGTLEWTEPAFVENGWEHGSAGFGYGDGDDSTVLADMRNGYSTLYVRKSFAVAQPAGSGPLELVIDYDDGFVAFLNGHEIARANAGPAGVNPAFNAIASASHEAGTAVVFRIDGGESLLVPGANVLAIVGLNAGADSGDFSLHPRLRAAGLLGEGCPGEYYVAGSQAALAGKANAPGTMSVKVNGEASAFDPGTASWSHHVSLPPGTATFSVEAIDSAGAVLASQTLRVTSAQTLGGDIEDGTILTASGRPHVVVGEAAVRAGHHLVLEAGCELFFLAGSGLLIEGQIVANGTAAAPVRFTRLPCGQNWGSFQFQGSRENNRFAFCEWSYATGDPGAITLDDSNLELESCAIRDIDGEGVRSTDSTTRIRRCLTERTREALSLDRGDTVVEFCIVRNVTGKSDLIDCNGSTDPPPRIAFNQIYGTTDDGIDADGSSIIAEWNIIHDCGDQAFSLVGEGSSRVSHNLCYQNGHGLSVKDSQLCYADFNTFALNTITGVRAIQKTPGRGGGIVTLRNSIIWGNAAQLLLEADGTIDTAFCDVEGGVVPGAGNLSQDPRFVNPLEGAFDLQETSPCIGVAADGSDLGAFPRELVPRAPSDLNAVPQGSDAVWLSWRDNSAVETGFEVERSLGGGGFEFLGEVPANQISLLDTGLVAGLTYRYRVRATSGRGASAWSEVATAVPESPPVPAINEIEPASGPSRGGTIVHIRGRNFVGAVTALMGGAPLTDVEVISTEELRGVAPPGPRGAADVLIRTPGGEAVLAGGFAYSDSYRRGDVDGDEARTISDVLAILRYLFQDGARPPCPAVADTTGDAEVDLADAVFLLFHLFAGGSPPEPNEAQCLE